LAWHVPTSYCYPIGINPTAILRRVYDGMNTSASNSRVNLLRDYLNADR
jgi:hypothetical protein